MPDDAAPNWILTHQVTQFMEMIPGASGARHTFQIDEKVRVMSGLLAGLEGRVVSRRATSRVVLAINAQQGVLLEIDDVVLEPLSQYPESKA